MNKERIKTYLLDFQERKIENIKDRDTIIRDSNKIKVIIGARRNKKNIPMV
jgi:hypothetical protein